MTLHPHPQRNEWVTGCLVCGKSYDQVIEETVADYLNQTAQPGETVRERQIKRNAFIAGIFRAESSLFSPRECRRLPPVTAWSTPLITIEKTWAHRDMLCPYLKTKLTNCNQLIRWIKSPHVYEIYLYINIHIYNPIYIFISRYLFHYRAKSIQIAKKLVSLENGYKQMLIVLI